MWTQIRHERSASENCGRASPSRFGWREAGERTVVTVGGRPVAQLGPLDADAPDLERLIGSGAVIPPRRTSEWRPPEPVPVWAGVRIDQVLRELRG